MLNNILLNTAFIYRFHVLHEARHHELNEISDYKLILTYTAINVEQRN